MKSRAIKTIALSLFVLAQSGCWLVAAGAGAEAAYVTTQDDRTAGETVVDQRISTEVKTRLIASSDVSGGNINVDTNKRIVTLRGFVQSEKELTAALEIARSVDGVSGVVSKLSYQP